MNRIKILSELVINQIAAGEVIERPASILKELLENSIDAKSSMIRVYLENGGINGIKVMDNGIGIDPEDLPLVCKQHATSKIVNIGDLDTINSLGFRGEALASIAAIAKIDLQSNRDHLLAPPGTTITVKDIFYNVPVRRKFLRASNVEFNYVQEMFKKIALSNFAVGFMLYNNVKLIKSLPAINAHNLNSTQLLDQKSQRIAKLLGSKFMEHAFFFNTKINDLQLCGWISNVYAISGSQIQYLYLNNRVIKDKLLNAAIKQAAQSLSIIPAYCLYFKVDPRLVDVNVHPTKQEVRFSDPKVMYAFIYESVVAAIQQFKFESQNNLVTKKMMALQNYDDSHDRNYDSHHNITYVNDEAINNYNNLNNKVDFKINSGNLIMAANVKANTDANANDLNDNNLNKNTCVDEVNNNVNISNNSSSSSSINNISSVNSNNHSNNKDNLDSNGIINNITINSNSNSNSDSSNINNISINKSDLKIFPIFNNAYILFIYKDLNVEPLKILPLKAGLIWLLMHSLQQTAQLIGYQLLIPVRVKVANIVIENLATIVNLLAEFKFEIIQIHADVLLIKSIPEYLYIFEIQVDYGRFFMELITMLLSVKGNMEPIINVNLNMQLNIINLLIDCINFTDLSGYTHKDLIKLIIILIAKQFNFLDFNKDLFEKILKKF